MQLGDQANTGAASYGKPLDGVRVLAAEQMQALPFATQLLARLGADIIKVEHPVHGESGRGASPAMIDPEGRAVGATYLRNNLCKRSVGIDLKSGAGQELFTELAANFDVVAENFKAGTMDRLGLGHEYLLTRYPGLIYVSLSGFGNDPASPYRDWPAYAAIVEAMSGLYHYKDPDHPPRTIPAGALGDISTALFSTVGILAALRHRDRTGEGQYLDVAMLDSMMAMTDVVTNFWSMGVRPNRPLEVIVEGFEAKDGYVVLQVVREHHFAALAELVGRPDWVDDPRFATRAGWVEHLESEIRPAVEGWLADKTRVDAVHELAAVKIAAGPSYSALDVINDEHVAVRNMLVEMPRTDDVDEPILIPGNPIKLSKVAEGPETRVPWVGEHTDDLLAAELGYDDAQLAGLRQDGVIT